MYSSSLSPIANQTKYIAPKQLSMLSVALIQLQLQQIHYLEQPRQRQLVEVTHGSTLTPLQTTNFHHAQLSRCNTKSQKQMEQIILIYLTQVLQPQ